MSKIIKPLELIGHINFPNSNGLISQQKGQKLYSETYFCTEECHFAYISQIGFNKTVTFIILVWIYKNWKYQQNFIKDQGKFLYESIYSLIKNNFFNGRVWKNLL